MENELSRNAPTTPKRCAGLEKNFIRERRRAKVFEMRLAGLTIAEMVSTLGCAKNTVIADLRGLNDDLMLSLDPAKARMLLTEKLAEYRIVKRTAVRALSRASGNEGIGLLNSLMAVIEKEGRLMQDAGLLPKKEDG